MCNEETICERLLTAAGHQGPFKLTPIVGGRNNKVSRVQRGEQSFLLKSFFHSADDPRDRYGAETRFYEFVDRNQIAQTPKLAATSRNDKAILIEFIEGSRVRSEDIGSAEFRAAFDFAIALNSNVSGVSRLSAASEACFSLSAYCDLLDNRITRLANLASDTAALKFIHQELVPKWSATREQLCSADTGNADFDLLNSERVVSPSDFGFHNCIRQHDGSLIFYDFEYAGLDDPAKLICDFFCQVDVPVPATFLDEALDEFGRHLDRREALEIRVRTLMPIIQLKWCCILLNEFLDTDAARRTFAGSSANAAAREYQLTKARDALRQVN